MATSAKKNASVPTPPRLSGDFASDLVAIREWMQQFYSATVVQSGLLDPSFQSDAGTFNPASLPDPTDTSIARAQDTANHAYVLAATADAVANDAEARALLLIVPFTLSNANNQLTATFTAPFASADAYRVLCQAEDFSGTPGVNAFVVIKVARTAANFVVTIAAAPGAGNSVSFNAFVFPKN